jgi:tRNA threonylcarbamoyladenosine biosynthesis protein TsaB
VILAIDTATPVGSVALVASDKVVINRYFDIGLQHSKRLFVEIDEACRAVAVEIADLDAVAVSIGPGSFTGLRIGLAAAKGLCLAAAKGLLTVSTLEAVAARLPYACHPVCALLDARKKQVYAGLYDMAKGWPRELSGPVAIAPEDLLQMRAGQPTIYTGDGADAYRDLINSSQGALWAPLHCARPEAGAIGALAWNKLRRDDWADLAAVEPQYLRAPDAKITSKSPLLN